MNAESVGGSMFEIAVNALAKKGRVVIIGMMSQYSSGWKPSENTGLPEKLLWKSATLSGMFSFASEVQINITVSASTNNRVSMYESPVEVLLALVVCRNVRNAI